MSEEKKKVGLAAASPETRKRVSSMGGKACVGMNKGHRWSREEASAAGKLSAEKHPHRGARRKKIPFNEELVKEIDND